MQVKIPKKGKNIYKELSKSRVAMETSVFPSEGTAAFAMR